MTAPGTRARVEARGVVVDEVHRRVLDIVFDNTRVAIAEILLSFDDEATIRRAIAAFWSYQLPGLEGLQHTITATD